MAKSRAATAAEAAAILVPPAVRAGKRMGGAGDSAAAAADDAAMDPAEQRSAAAARIQLAWHAYWRRRREQGPLCRLRCVLRGSVFGCADPSVEAELRSELRGRYFSLAEGQAVPRLRIVFAVETLKYEKFCLAAVCICMRWNCEGATASKLMKARERAGG